MSVVNDIYRKAENSIKSNDKLKSLIATAKDKLVRLKDDDNERGTFIKQVNLLVRMVKTYVNGEYRAFTYQTILLLVFGLAYFITPFDLIPDFIPALGLTDDISILYMVMKSVAADIEAYQEWEADNDQNEK